MIGRGSKERKKEERKLGSYFEKKPSAAEDAFPHFLLHELN